LNVARRRGSGNSAVAGAADLHVRTIQIGLIEGVEEVHLFDQLADLHLLPLYAPI
jgi:hypothetical protein